MSAVEDALSKIRSVSTTAHAKALQAKASGGSGFFGAGFVPSDGLSQLGQFQQQGANRLRYSLFHGWVHAAIHALATEAAGQSVRVGRPVAKIKKEKPGKTKAQKFRGKKEVDKAIEVVLDHPLLESLEFPNKIQDSWQFVYSFVANLCLTGWSFVVRDENDDGKIEYFSLPTTWVHPIHDTDAGAFGKFRIMNPNNPSAGTGEVYDRTQVSFAYFPNPSDPFSALSLTQAQQRAIKIDDHIQTSQSTFFENGVFPSAIVTVGTQPHPQVPGGIRPRLNAPQRRQIYAAIKKVMGGVANYGNPAIVDGLIEKIERLSMTSNEMGWNTSEVSTRRRILSAFGVHPFILGEEVAGSYAQSYNVEKRFYGRVNVLLKLLGRMMTELNKDDLDGDKIFWEELIPVDPQMDVNNWNAARARGDVSQNEWRHKNGLPPDEDEEQAEIDKSAVQSVTNVAMQVSQGGISAEQGQAILEGMGLPADLAKRIAGSGPPEDEEISSDDYEGGLVPPLDENLEESLDESDLGAVQKAARAIDKAIGFLSRPVSDVADSILLEIE